MVIIDTQLCPFKAAASPGITAGDAGTEGGLTALLDSTYFCWCNRPVISPQHLQPEQSGRVFRWSVESYLCWVSGSVSSSDSWGGWSREKPCEWNHRVCGLTASNCRSDGVSLATVHTVSSHSGKDAAGVLLLFLCELEKPSYEQNWPNKKQVFVSNLKVTPALLKEPQSSVLIWWVDGESDRQTILRPHKSSRLPENDCFWLFSLDDCVSVSSLCQITVGKSFTSSLKNAAASFKPAPEPYYWWLLIISVVRDLRRSATGSFVLLKQSACSVALSSSWCLVIKPLSCSLSSCSVNQGVARHVTVWRIALCNAVISARSPPTQPAAMGPGSQPPAACYYHNPAAWVLSASDLLRHEQLQQAAHSKQFLLVPAALWETHNCKVPELHVSSLQNSQQTQTQRRRRFPPETQSGEVILHEDAPELYCSTFWWRFWAVVGSNRTYQTLFSFMYDTSTVRPPSGHVTSCWMFEGLKSWKYSVSRDKLNDSIHSKRN